MAAMTTEQVKAVGKQGWAVRRKITATLVVGGQEMKVTVIGDLKDGALIARADGFLAHAPVDPACLDISEADAAHLDGVWEDAQALTAGRFFSGGSVSGDHRNSWGVGSR